VLKSTQNLNNTKTGYLQNQQQLSLPDLINADMKDLVMKTKRGKNG